MAIQERHEPRQKADFLEELANDAEYQARTREYEQRWAAEVAKNMEDAAGLHDELQHAGIHVILEPKPWEPDGYEGPPRSISDLVNTKSRYPEAIPILVKHLQMEHRPDIRDAIIRALIVPEFQGIATDALIEEFRKIDAPTDASAEYELKWNLGRAIAGAATPNSMPAILELVTDKKHGSAREYLPLGLRFLSKEEAKTILKPLLNDPDVRDRTMKTLKMISKRKH